MSIHTAARKATMLEAETHVDEGFGLRGPSLVEISQKFRPVAALVQTVRLALMSNYRDALDFGVSSSSQLQQSTTAVCS